MGARAFGFGDRNARSDMITRMAGHSADIDVVQIVIPARRAIGESSKIGGSLACRADDGSGPLDALRDFTADAHGPLVEGGDAATERVDDVRFDAFNGRGIQIFITQRGRIRGQSFRQWSSFGCVHRTRKAVHAERCYSSDNAAAGNLPAVDRVRHRSHGWKGSTWVLRTSGADSGEIINWIIARAASGSFEFVDRPTLDVHGLFRKPGNGPT